MNSFLLFMAGLLVVALSTLFAAPYFVDWNDYRDVFEAQASKLIGRQVDVGGDVSLTLLPAPVLRFETVNVADAQGGYDTPLASAKSVTVWLSVPPLLSGTVEARSVEIVQPVVNIRLNEDGTGNWSDLGGEAAELPFIPKEVALNSVTINNATVNIWRGKPEPNSVIDTLDGELSARALAGPYKFNGTFTLAGEKKELRLSTARPDDSGQFGLKASIRSPRTGDNYTIDGAVRGFGTVPVFRGKFHARLAETSAPREGEAEGEKAQKPAPFEIKSEMFAGLTGAQFEQFELTVTKNDKPQTVTGLMDVTFEKGLVVSGSFSSPYIDLDSWISSGEGTTPDLQTVLSGVADELLDHASGIREGVVRLLVDQVVMGGDLSTSLSTTLITKEKKVELADFSVDLPGNNQLRMQGSLTRDAEKGPVFTTPFTLRGQSLSRLLKWAGVENEPDVATQTAQFSVEGNLTAGRDVFELAEAEGNLFGSAFTGSLGYSGGQDGELKIALKSDHLDLARLLGEKASAKSLVSLLDANDGGKNREGASASGGWLGGIRTEADVNIGTLTLTGLGEAALEVKLVRSEDSLDIRRLVLASQGNVNIQAGGRLTGLSGSPQGNLTLAVHAGSGAGIRSLGEFLEMPGIATRSPERLAALTPLRMTAAVRSASPDSTGLDVQLEGAAGSSDLLMKMSLEGKPAEWRSARIAVQGSMRNESGTDLLQQLRPELKDGDLDAFTAGAGTLTIEADGVARDGLQTSLILDAGDANWTTQGIYKTGESESGFSGTTALTAKNTAAGLALLGIRVAPGQGAEPVSVSASLEGAQGVYHFSNLKGDFGGAAFSGDLRADTSKERPKFTAAISAPHASLPRLFAPTIDWTREKGDSEAIRGVTVQDGYWPDSPFDTRFITSADATLSLNADRLELSRGLELENAGMQAALSNGTLRVSKLEGALYGGTFNARGELVSRGGGVALDARVEASDLRVDQMTVTADGDPLINAAANITFSVRGEGLTPRGLISALAGTGEVKLGDGNINGFSLGAAHAAAAAAQEKKDEGGLNEQELGRKVTESLKSSEMAFTPIKLPFTVGNGIVEFEKIALSDAEGRVTIASYVQLANLQLDSEWALQSAASAGGAKPRVSLVFSGELQNVGKLQPRIDTAGLARYVTIRNMEKDVERLENLDVSGRKSRSQPAPQQEQKPAVQAQATTANKPTNAEPPAPSASSAPPPVPVPPTPERKQTTAPSAPRPPDSDEPPPARAPDTSRKREAQTAAPAATSSQPAASGTSEPPPIMPTIPTAEPPAAATAPAPATQPEQPSADAPEPPIAPTSPSSDPPAAAPGSNVVAAPQQPAKPSRPAPLPSRKPPAPPPAAAAPAPAPPPAARTAPGQAPNQQAPNLPWLQTTNPPASAQAPAQTPNAPIPLPVPPAASEPPQEQQQAPAPQQRRQDDFDPFSNSSSR